jgi:hypothetical protein
VLIAPSDRTRISANSRRTASVIIAGVVSVALGVVTITMGGSASTVGTFALFVVSLPWTVSVYILTMVFNVTSPVAIGVVLALVTLVMWRYVGRLIMRTCVSPRER